MYRSQPIFFWSGDMKMKNRSAKFEKKQYSFIKAALISVAAGIALTAALTLGASAAISGIGSPESLYAPLSYIAPVLSAFGAGFLCALLCRAKGLVRGALTGIMFFFVFAVAALALPDGISTASLLIRAGLYTLAGAVGGFLGVGVGKNN